GVRWQAGLTGVCLLHIDIQCRYFVPPHNQDHEVLVGMIRRGFQAELPLKESRSAGFSLAAAPRPPPQPSRARKQLRKAPPILDFRFWILDYRKKNPDIAPRILYSFSSPPIENRQSKIENVIFMTLSARTSTFGVIVRPICLAVFRLMMTQTSSGLQLGTRQHFVNKDRAAH